ncbi:hypothetical protein GGS20DRAFT_578230 [Poronia punctata]|nr:hypothetical protein GGS20DRAFT_578230 [Poronia punctata]
MAEEESSSNNPSSFLQTIPLEHIPPTHTVHIALFKDVTNADFLHRQLLARNSEFEYAFIDAEVITSQTHILSAVFRAIVGDKTRKTANVHSEIVISLSSSNNISEAYRRYGITGSSKHILVVKVLSPENDDDVTKGDVERHLRDHVKGTPVPFTDEMLAELVDWGRVRKYYKLNGVGWLDGIKDVAVKDAELHALMLGGMALRGI